MDAELTPWFRGVLSPARPGVYLREFPHRAMYAEWTGYQWLVAASSPRAAKRKRIVSQQQDTIRWRGLAADPAGVEGGYVETFCTKDADGSPGGGE